MNQYKIMLKLHNKKTISEYVSGNDEKQARHNAFKFTVPMYKKYGARVEVLSVSFFRKLPDNYYR